MIVEALALSVYFGESLTTGSALTSDALMAALAEREVRLAMLVRGIEGFGINRRVHAERFPDISTDLPLLTTVVDERARIEAVLDDVDRTVPRGLVTLEPVTLATEEDVAGATVPEGTGAAAKLTVYCGRGRAATGRPAHREAVELLWRHDAGGAIVLLGVDGVARGRRTKARLFASSRETPVAIVSVGPPLLLERALPHLRERLPGAIVTLERVAQLKHDGDRLEPLPVTARGAPDSPVWHALQVYTRRSAGVDGRSLHSELTRRIRRAGGAGITTIAGEWGYSSDEAPFGDRLGRLGSHSPSYTVYIDRPAKVAELWPIVDALTAHHGIVTWRAVPTYRERAGDSG